MMKQEKELNAPVKLPGTTQHVIEEPVIGAGGHTVDGVVGASRRKGGG